MTSEAVNYGENAVLEYTTQCDGQCSYIMFKRASDSEYCAYFVFADNQTHELGACNDRTVEGVRTSDGVSLTIFNTVWEDDGSWESFLFGDGCGDPPPPFYTELTLLCKSLGFAFLFYF